MDTSNGLRDVPGKKKKKKKPNMSIRGAMARVAATKAKEYFLNTDNNYRNMHKLKKVSNPGEHDPKKLGPK